MCVTFQLFGYANEVVWLFVFYVFSSRYRGWAVIVAFPDKTHMLFGKINTIKPCDTLWPAYVFRNFVSFFSVYLHIRAMQALACLRPRYSPM